MGINIILNELQKDLLSLSARHKAGGYRRARRFPDDRQMALFLRGVDRDDGAWGSGSDGSGTSPNICQNVHESCLLRVCTCVFFTSLYSCNSTLWWFSMMISTTMFWNLMFIMAATVSSCDLISVGPKIIPKLDTVIRFWLQWLDTLNNQETGL